MSIFTFLPFSPAGAAIRLSLSLLPGSLFLHFLQCCFLRVSGRLLLPADALRFLCLALRFLLPVSRSLVRFLLPLSLGGGCLLHGSCLCLIHPAQILRNILRDLLRMNRHSGAIQPGIL